MLIPFLLQQDDFNRSGNPMCPANPPRLLETHVVFVELYLRRCPCLFLAVARIVMNINNPDSVGKVRRKSLGFMLFFAIWLLIAQNIGQVRPGGAYHALCRLQGITATHRPLPDCTVLAVDWPWCTGTAPIHPECAPAYHLTAARPGETKSSCARILPATTSATRAPFCCLAGICSLSIIMPTTPPGSVTSPQHVGHHQNKKEGDCEF